MEDLGANKYIIPDFSCIRLESLHESLWPRNRNSRLFSTALTGNMQALSFSRQMIQGWNSHGMISKHLRLDQTISGATVFKSSCINLFSAWLEEWNSSIFLFGWSDGMNQITYILNSIKHGAHMSYSFLFVLRLVFLVHARSLILASLVLASGNLHSHIRPRAHCSLGRRTSHKCGHRISC